MPDVIGQTDVLIANSGSVADIFGLLSEGSQIETSLAASAFVRREFPSSFARSIGRNSFRAAAKRFYAPTNTSNHTRLTTIAH